jgi:lipid A 3-O-deacylase
MTFKLRHLLLSLCIVSTLAEANGSNWIDGISLSYGHDSNDNETDLLRAGLQNKWQRTWFNGGAWYVGGYWDAELAYMESDVSAAGNEELFDLSLTPVFRMQRDASLSSGVSPFAEAGIGAHLLTDTRLGDRAFSTALQMGSVLGLGLGFGDNGQYELSYRYQRLSNIGIKNPNDGMDLHLLRFGYHFTQ